MKLVATHNGRTVTWWDGVLGGDEELVDLVHARVDNGEFVSFHYWGAREPDLTGPFDAYITIGAVMSEFFADTLGPDLFNEVPDNPDGYEPEGPRETPPIVAAAWRFLGERNRLTL